VTASHRAPVLFRQPECSHLFQEVVLYLSSVRGVKGNNKWMHPGAREWPKKNPQWY
jgi:hypothetical protein